MKKHLVYYIPMLGMAKYVRDVENGVAYISPRTDLFTAYHLGSVAILTVILSIWANS